MLDFTERKVNVSSWDFGQVENRGLAKRMIEEVRPALVMGGSPQKHHEEFEGRRKGGERGGDADIVMLDTTVEHVDFLTGMY